MDKMANLTTPEGHKMDNTVNLTSPEGHEMGNTVYPTWPRGHPDDPRSNVAKFNAYDPDKYVLHPVGPGQLTSETLLPNRPPCLTQNSVGMYLRATTRELDEVPPRPNIDELKEPIINRMAARDKAFWVDKPGANAYNLHDAFYNYGLTTTIVKPTPQSMFPRSYQYDLDCVKYRRSHACDGMKQTDAADGKMKPIGSHCRDCSNTKAPAVTGNVAAKQKRWRHYPDLSSPLSPEEVQKIMMFEVGRPFQNEACNWYNTHYPSQKYDVIARKFCK